MPTSDDNDDASSGAGRDTPPPSRRIIDFQLDNGDDDWEDLPSLGTSTHRSRNPGQSCNPVKKCKRLAGGKNARASAFKRRSANTSKMQRLTVDLDAVDEALEGHAECLSDKYSMKIKDVHRRMLASSNYKTQRKPSLYNAKISAIMADMNTGCEGGNRLTIPDVKELVKEDPSLLEGYTTEEEKQMVADLGAKRERKGRGTRANNIAANVDIKRTIGRLVEEVRWRSTLTWSASQCSREATPTTISTGGALDFFRDVLKKEPADVSALFELWAVNQEQGTKGPNTLCSMQKECTEMIQNGLMAITKRTKVAMNYENYIRSMVEAKNIGLVGWPQGVAFKHMSLQSAIPPLKILRDALQVGTCRWKILTPSERERILTNFKDMVKKGEVKVKARSSMRAATKKSSAQKKASTKKGKKGKESSEEDESGSERASTGSGPMVHEKLLALVAGKKAKAKAVKQAQRKGEATSAGDDNARPTKGITTLKDAKQKTMRTREAPAKPKKTAKRPAKKCKKASAGDSDDEPPAKKRKKAGAGYSDDEPPTKKRKKASAGDGDNEPPPKRKKMSAEEDAPAEARPRRLHKKPASAATPAASDAPAHPVSLTPRSPAASASAASAPVRPILPRPRSPPMGSRGHAASPTASLHPTVKGKRGSPLGLR
ncbi:hypothetical protein B0H13DRAFT_2343103 [Mycena leptocephala]|nr:hypothetical protein B0H13DRAFT_2343103 [Mycena leptocephala]